MSRVFMIGWDGATFDLILPWVAEGKLPTIARLLESGAHGPLRSTVPPWTFPAWTSFMTGKNPGKHGIYDFFKRRTGAYDLDFVNGAHRRAPTFWKLLSDAGRQVISISIPCTFPPEPVNGVMISGFDTPVPGAEGAFVDERGMHPPALAEELRRNVGRYPIGAFVANVGEINQGRPDLALEKVIETIRTKAAAAKYLASSRPWDCFMILFGESDGAGHQFWKYCDPRSPLFTDRPPGLRDAILQVYQELDRQAGELLALAPPDTTVLMMSDHGFGGVGDWFLYPNCWLGERGLLRFLGGTSQRVARGLEAVKQRAVAALPGGVKRFLYKNARAGLGRFESRVRHGMIDWAGTVAYFEENPYYPTLWVNLKGRQPQGVVEPGAEYERVRDRLIEELRGWRHPDSGEPVVLEALRREEVYSGPYLDDAPDVVVRWALHRGYSYAFRLSAKSRDRRWTEKVDPTRSDNLQFFTSKSGTHRDDGIFLAQGPTVRPGLRVEGSRIIDLAPTVLGLLGVPAPADMDGRVLGEVFIDAPAPILAATAPAQAADDATPEGYYSPEDEETISERLKALGYID